MCWMKERTTPEIVTELKPNQVFVYGSNSKGINAGGAARIAEIHFGAIRGKSKGEHGKSYAIETLKCFDDFEGKPFMLSKKTLEEIRVDVVEFAKHARSNPNKTYLVTEIGCGIAGFKIEEMANLFLVCTLIDNIHLPRRFWNHIKDITS